MGGEGGGGRVLTEGGVGDCVMELMVLGVRDKISLAHHKR